jgi:hypothetical protein
VTAAPRYDPRVRSRLLRVAIIGVGSAVGFLVAARLGVILLYGWGILAFVSWPGRAVSVFTRVGVALAGAASIACGVQAMFAALEEEGSLSRWIAAAGATSTAVGLTLVAFAAWPRRTREPKSSHDPADCAPDGDVVGQMPWRPFLGLALMMPGFLGVVGGIVALVNDSHFERNSAPGAALLFLAGYAIRGAGLRARLRAPSSTARARSSSGVRCPLGID